MRVLTCIPPYAEKTIAHSQTLGDWIHLGLGAIALNDTVSINSISYMVGDIDQPLWALASVTHCIQSLLATRNKRAWSLLRSLSPSTIIVSDPPPTLTDCQQGIGVFIALDTLSGEERKELERYLAPEIPDLSDSNFDRLSNSDREKAGVFTMGLLLLECVTGTAPFDMDVPERAHWKIRKNNLPPLPALENTSLAELIQSMLTINASSRPTFRVVAQKLQESLL